MAAVAFLARRDYACGELAEKLRERGFEPALVQALVADLAARRLLDDARYAGHYVDYHRARGQGPLRIRRDLEAFGVAAVLIDAALAAVADWAALAREVRRRRFGPEVPADWSGKGRQARFLQYRGFSNDHIRSALGPDLELDS
jgi:regulatory protein